MKTIKIPELKIEVETEVHDKGKKLPDIKIPNEWRLLTMQEMIFLYNNYEKELNLTDTWEFIEQPFKKFMDKYTRFDASSGCAYVNCVRVLGARVSGWGYGFVEN